MRNSRGERFFRESVIPHRNELITLMNQVNKIDQRNTDAGEERVKLSTCSFKGG